MIQSRFPFASLAPAASTALAVLALIGCGDGRLPRRPVSGSVQVDGQPAAGAVVVLHPVAGSVAAEAEKLRPTGRCDSAGRFFLGTWETADGVPAGRWQATVEWHASAAAADTADPEESSAEVDRLAGHYADPQASLLAVEVADAAVLLPPFELRSPSPAGSPPPR